MTDRSSFQAEVTAASPNSAPRRSLSIVDCVGVTIGIIIGSGIYKTTPLIAGQTGSLTSRLLEVSWIASLPQVESWLPAVVLSAAWGLGAAIALCGALCYAELASTYPHHGGDYIYLKRAFGDRVGFFFVWCEFWIIRPANIGAVAFVFGEYGLRFLRAAGPGTLLSELAAHRAAPTAAAILAIVALTISNLFGVRAGIRLQNMLSLSKVLGLLAIVIVAYTLPPLEGIEIRSFDTQQAAGGSFALAMVLIMFTLGGWNDLAFVSAEVRDPRRTLLGGLLLGLASVTGIYILVSLALIHGLGYGGLVASNEAAAELLASRVGTAGDSAIAALIAVSTLGAINGMLYAGGRIYYALGTEHKSFAWIGVWNEAWGGPVRGLLAQTLITVVLVLTFGLYSDGFERLVNFSTLFFWSFFLLVGIALFVLRRKDRDRHRPYRVTFYPVVPILFCLSSIYVLYSSTRYAMSVGGWEWAWAVCVVVWGDWIAQGSAGERKRLPSGGPVAIGALLTLGALIGSLASLTSRFTWFGELCSHFPLQFAGLALAGAAAFRWGGRRHLTILALLLSVLLGWWSQADRWREPPLKATESEVSIDDRLTVASLNVLVVNDRFDEVLATIRRLDADVVVVLEVSQAWGEQLATLVDTWPHQAIHPSEDAFGIAVLAKEFASFAPVQPTPDSPLQLLARVNRRHGEAWFIGATHVPPPINPAMAKMRDASLAAWAQELLGLDQPAMMVGDFNDTPWSPAFRSRLVDGTLHDSRVPHGLQPTWPAWLGPLGIPIDHALLTTHLVCEQRETFVIPGSDHLGLLFSVTPSQYLLNRRGQSNPPAPEMIPGGPGDDEVGALPPHAARGTDGAVATVHPLATQAGIEALERGGNAVDAAVAAALTLGVVDGHNSGIGGGCFVLVHTADGRILAIDGRETAPSAAHRDAYRGPDGSIDEQASRTGARAAGVPGSLAAYEMILEEAGELSLAQLLESAAVIAERGFAIDRVTAGALQREARDLAKFPGSAEVFVRSDGRPWREGDRLVQTDLARTYRSIATEGTDWFYDGPFAESVGAWMAEHDGWLTAEDFRSYRAVQREPLETSYRGRRIIGFPPPSSGGVHVAQLLGMLERFDLAHLERESPELRLHVTVEAMQRAFTDRAVWLGDPDFVPVPRGLIEPRYLEQRSAEIELDRASQRVEAGSPEDFDERRFERHTTHIAAADAAGNWVAITATLNTTFGSKVIVPGTGVMLNNQMDDFSIAPGVPNAFGLVGAEANAVAGGKRPLSSMSPTLVLEGDRPVMALGGAGGPRIITQVLGVIIGVIDLELDPAEALARPRFHYQAVPDVLFVEPGLSADLLERMPKRSAERQVEGALAAVQVVSLLEDGKGLQAAHDPRVPGGAAGWNAEESRQLGPKDSTAPSEIK